MPETVAPPAAPAAPSAPASPPAVSIKLPGTAVPQPKMDTPPKPGSAMSRMREKMQTFANKEAAKAPRPGAPDAKPDPEPKPELGKETEVDPALEGLDDSHLTEEQAGKTDAPATEKVSAADPKKEKVSPWRLVDQWKGRAAELEKQLAERNGGAPSSEEKKAYEEKLTTYQKRVQDLEDKMVLHDYRNSQAFKDTYEKPYFDTYNSARTRVAAMKTENGEAATPESFDAIMSQPDDDSAAVMIEEMFGTGVKASTVTQLREKVLELSRAATSHLKEQTEAGNAKLKEQAENFTKFQTEMKAHITKTWDAANKALLEDPKVGDLFKQREGDPEWNQRLAKGFELTDRAFSENASDPRLTPDQRASIVKRHAAVRNRAAAFGALRFEVSRLQQQLSAANKELEGYKGSEPGGGHGKGKLADATVPKSGSAWERLQAELRKVAH